MADRSAADLFGIIMRVLASEVTAGNDVVARRVARTIYDCKDHFDFTIEQAHCDDELVTLGLARRARRDFGRYIGEHRIDYMRDDYDPGGGS
jgi:hypothetical protein